MRALGVQGHSASGVERVHWTFLGLSQPQIFDVPAASGGLSTSHAAPLQPRLPRMKGKNLSHRFGADRRLFLLLLAQLAANSGEGFSQISFHTFRVAERRIKDGLHLVSTRACEMHRYSARFADPCCKRRSISDQIAKFQPLTANASCARFRNVKNPDTFAQTSPDALCGRQSVLPCKDAISARLRHEPVAHCGFGHKVFGLGWVIFELAPQMTHVHTNVVLMRYIRRPPNFAQYLAIRNYLFHVRNHRRK